MTEGFRQLDLLVGDWIEECKKFSEGRGYTTVAPTEDGKTIEGQREISEDGKSWKVDFDLKYTKVR